MLHKPPLYAARPSLHTPTARDKIKDANIGWHVDIMVYFKSVYHFVLGSRKDNVFLMYILVGSTQVQPLSHWKKKALKKPDWWRPTLRPSTRQLFCFFGENISLYKGDIFRPMVCFYEWITLFMASIGIFSQQWIPTSMNIMEIYPYKQALLVLKTITHLLTS